MDLSRRAVLGTVAAGAGGALLWAWRARQRKQRERELLDKGQGDKPPVVSVDAAKARRKSSYVEDHFEVDQKSGAVVGAKKHDENYQRDLHDWYNIITLIPINILNGLNWTWPKLVGFLSGSVAMSEFWHGRYFNQFYWATAAYFVIDAIWVTAVPICVASPTVIQVHHVATLLYTLIPRCFPEYGWLMGACMSVEVNTWLIIARRLFNKGGKEAFTFQANTPGGPLQVKVFSVAFYVTWIVIRLFIYPALFVVILKEWNARSALVGSRINCLTPAPFLQLLFCGLNYKWSFDLLSSKMRNKGPSKGL